MPGRPGAGAAFAETIGAEIIREGTSGPAATGEDALGEGRPGPAAPGADTLGEGRPGAGTPGADTLGEETPGIGAPGADTIGEATPAAGMPGTGTPGTLTLSVGCTGVDIRAIIQGGYPVTIGGSRSADIRGAGCCLSPRSDDFLLLILSVANRIISFFSSPPDTRTTAVWGGYMRELELCESC